MRKLSAIVLLFTFLMYHLGYYSIYITNRYQLEKTWEDKIENDKLSTQQLLLASMPLSLPYRPDQPHFQPTSGTVEINGKFYRIVKQRYAKDTLHIMYVKDIALEDLHQSLQDWIASFTQQPISEKGNYQFWKSVSKDFFVSAIQKTERITEDDQAQYGNYVPCFEEVTLAVPSPPPKV